MKIDGVRPPESGKAIRVQVGGSPVAIFNVGGQLLAVDATCPHAGGPLDRGPVTGDLVTCPLHGSQFNLRTGAVVRGPAVRPLHVYRVRVDGTGLQVDPA